MKVLLYCIVIFLMITIIFNPKINGFYVLKKQFTVYRNDKTKKVSKFDIISFVVAPLILSVVFSIIIDFEFILESRDILTTVFSLVATILFSFLAMLVNKEKNEKTGKVIEETYISISSTIEYSVFVVIMAFLLPLLNKKAWYIYPFLTVLYYLTVKAFITLLMVIKRMFILLSLDKTQ